MRRRPTPVVALTVVLALGLLALAGCTTKIVTPEGTTPLNTVTATGQGEESAVPDEAEMNFGAVAKDEKADAALKQASETADAIIKAVKNEGVKAEDIQTQNLSVYPEYREPTESQSLEITGYTANVSVKVTIRDIEKIGDIISAASDAGANEISGPSFTLSDESPARDKAIEKAIDDAKHRAEVMAKAAGKSVGTIISVSETGVNIPVYYGDAREYDVAEAAIEPGTLDVTANVTVVFELK